MTSITPILRIDKVKKNGNAPLYIRLIHNRQTKFKALGINASPEDWDLGKMRLKKSFPNSTRANNLIDHKIAEISDKILNNELKPTHNNPIDLLETPQATLFIEYSRSVIEKMKFKNALGTIRRTRSVINKVSQYLKGKDIEIGNITSVWLKGFDHHLRSQLGNSTNTVASNMKIIRKMIFEAVDDGLVNRNVEPFLGYKIKTEATDIDFLTEEELIRLMELPIAPSTILARHRDLFVFACHAAGIRIGDLLKLQWRNYENGRINLRTGKTKVRLDIKLGTVANRILENLGSCRKPNQSLFNLLPNGTDMSNEEELLKAVSSTNAHINKNLKILAKRASIDKNIHFHTSRHTWATLALRRGIRIEYVSKLLGHTSIKTTQRYAQIVNQDLDEAMELFDRSHIPNN